MKKILLFLICLVGIYCFDRFMTDEKMEVIENSEPTIEKKFQRQNQTNQNIRICKENEETIVSAIACVEGFSCQPYWCGAKWTIGYGNTALPNGSKVTATTAHINTHQGREYMKYHLNHFVYPYLTKIKRQCSPSELIALCMCMYNVGSGGFNGNAAFIDAINDDETLETVMLMTKFRYTRGEESQALLKRIWLQGAIYCGQIPLDVIPHLMTGGVYNEKIVALYQTSSQGLIKENGLLYPKLDGDTVSFFLKRQLKSKISV